MEGDASLKSTNRCNYFVERKGRFCKMTVKCGMQYCGQHLNAVSTESEIIEQSEETVTVRIVCPYDPKHSCYLSKLKKHMKKCNSKPRDLPPYIIPNINLNFLDATTSTGVNEKKRLGDISSEDLQKILQRIENVYDELPNISEDILTHDVFKEELQKAEYGPTVQKHLLQNSSLLGNLQKSSLLLDNTCYIEFGAGRGQLSFWLSKSLSEKKKCAFLLVDKGNQRHKCDNKLKDTGSSNICRIRADIADLFVGNIDVVTSSDQVVAVSKHLCGSGTDLALGCLASSMCDNSINLNVCGIVMALCCYHRCDWKSYSGKYFLLEKGFTPSDFNVLCSLVSWATSGPEKYKVWQNNNPKPSFSHRYRKLNLTQNQCEAIGKKCKTILDYGRIKFLENYNFSAKLVYYIDERITPENVCLIAVRSLL